MSQYLGPPTYNVLKKVTGQDISTEDYDTGWLNCEFYPYVGIYVKTTTATDVEIHVSPDLSYDILWETLSSVTEVKKVYTGFPWAYVRVIVKSPGTTASADVVVVGKFGPVPLIV